MQKEIFFFKVLFYNSINIVVLKIRNFLALLRTFILFF